MEYMRADSEIDGHQNHCFRFSDNMSYRPPDQDFGIGPASGFRIPRVKSEFDQHLPDESPVITDPPKPTSNNYFPETIEQMRDRLSLGHRVESRSSRASSDANARGSKNISNNPAGNGQIPVKRWSDMSNVSLGNSFVDTYSEVAELRIGYDPDATTTGNNFAMEKPSDDKDWLDDGPATTLVKILRVVAVLLIICDSFSDWWLILKFDSYACGANMLFDGHFSKYDICGSERERIRQLLSVFTIFGSVFAVLQILNIFLDFLRDKDGSKFQLFRPRTEVFISVFLEEFPQAVILLVFGFNCDCSRLSRLATLLSMLSGFLAAGVRYTTSYSGATRGNSCCWVWWRCCCCKDERYLFKSTTQECFCHCSIPCPLCCCTLNCDDCSWMPHTWMMSLCNTMSCFWVHCRQSEAEYGIRMMVNVGIFTLFFCLLAQVVLMGLLA